MQLGAASKAKKNKGAGGGLKGMLSKKNAPAASNVEESKGGSAAAGGEDVAALRAQIAQLQSELQIARSAAGNDAPAEDTSTKPELGYWKIRGLAAQIRYMFYYL